MIINVTHDKNIPPPLKGHPVFVIDVGLENTRMTSHRMGTQAGVAEISIEKTQGLVSFSLNFCL